MFGMRFPESALTRSQTAVRYGIDNSIPASLKGNAERLSCWLEGLEQKLQAVLPGIRLRISSGYRCPELNDRVGGSTTSYHKLALAADVEDDRGIVSNYDLAQAIKSVMTDYDKIILEFGQWVHVQIAQQGQRPRGECLTAQRQKDTKGQAKTVYMMGFIR